MGFGNLALTQAYLENTKKVAKSVKTESKEEKKD
jgi:hypothetical protein